jgi:hypothetical protein
MRFVSGPSTVYRLLREVLHLELACLIIGARDPPTMQQHRGRYSLVIDLLGSSKQVSAVSNVTERNLPLRDIQRQVPCP